MVALDSAATAIRDQQITPQAAPRIRVCLRSFTYVLQLMYALACVKHLPIAPLAPGAHGDMWRLPAVEAVAQLLTWLYLNDVKDDGWSLCQTLGQVLAGINDYGEDEGPDSYPPLFFLAEYRSPAVRCAARTLTAAAAHELATGGGRKRPNGEVKDFEMFYHVQR